MEQVTPFGEGLHDCDMKVQCGTMFDMSNRVAGTNNVIVNAFLGLTTTNEVLTAGFKGYSTLYKLMQHAPNKLTDPSRAFMDFCTTKDNFLANIAAYKVDKDLG